MSHLCRSQAESASVRAAVLWEFPFGIQYAWMLLIFAMTTVYSLLCPLITPFGECGGDARPRQMGCGGPDSIRP